MEQYEISKRNNKNIIVNKNNVTNQVIRSVRFLFFSFCFFNDYDSI